MLTITKSSLHWHQHEVKSGHQDPIAWFPQPIVRYLSLPLLARHHHKIGTGGRLLVTEEQVVTVPVCIRKSSNIQSQSSYISATWGRWQSPDPDRLGANRTLKNKRIISKGKLLL